MQPIEHVRRMADYNRWMNIKIYASCEQLAPHQLAEDRKAFFGSVLGTLNHLLVTDIIWLKRFAVAMERCSALDPVRELPWPASLDAVLCANLNDLKARREMLDEVFLSLASALQDDDLAHIITYRSMKGIEARKAFFDILMHVFNHQTHHRGQLSTLLCQFGLDVGVTDLLMLLPDR